MPPYTSDASQPTLFAPPAAATPAPDDSAHRQALTHLLTATSPPLQNRAILHADWVTTPLGSMLAIADATHLHLLEFCDREALPREIKGLQASLKAAFTFSRTPLLQQLALELDGFFSGRSAAFHLPLAFHGTAFSQRVWQALQAVPPAATQSYRDLAHTLGQPTATRAVARANGANQLAILVPCHRIVGHNGDLTGYSGGLWRKQWLLDHERRHFLSHR